MATEPELMREQIEQDRGNLALHVDQLADRTSPRRIAQRNLDKVSDKARSLRDAVMGTSSAAGQGIKDAAGTVGDAVGSVGDAVGSLPNMAARRTRGNPLAMGLIAFGAGLLAASLIPESDAERRAAHQLADSDMVKGVAAPLGESVDRMRSDLGDRAKEAGQQVAETAKQAASATAEQAKEATKAATS